MRGRRPPTPGTSGEGPTTFGRAREDQRLDLGPPGFRDLYPEVVPGISRPHVLYICLSLWGGTETEDPLGSVRPFG